ncbi:hypothetical protein G6F31_013043 [Rhizopus arrhizus]|nr:hypothetical protein G6F31_013043 [Rhizopus arrhizus]
MGTIPGFPARGLAPIWIAHVTFTLCFVTVVVSSRLQEMDLSLEEAAMDLGASRLTVFGRITLPIIAPALLRRHAGFDHAADEGVRLGAHGHQPEDQCTGNAAGVGGIDCRGDRLVHQCTRREAAPARPAAGAAGQRLRSAGRAGNNSAGNIRLTAGGAQWGSSSRRSPMTVEIVDPATGLVTYRHELMGAADIEQRLQAAAEAFPGWADRSLQERGAILRQIAAQLRARRDDLQQAMTHEMGKLKAEALAEVDKCAAACEYYADHAADYLKPQLIDTEAQRSYVRYEPIGCVFAVMPWIFPIWQVFRFLAPAFMAGNVALLKHASNVPQCADLILAVCRDGGLPEGVFDVLHIDNDQAADVLRDARVKAVTLTGSERAGRSIASNAGSQLKKSVMELGVSDAFVVLDDADLD